MPPVRLVERHPAVPRERLVADLVPPPRFDTVRFDSYLPDPNEPSQAAAVAAMRAFEARLEPPRRRGLFRRPAEPDVPRGVYLDGGYGVGKTHLLASLWHAAPDAKAYCTFVELTHLVGALGFQETIEALGEHRLLCIDEFELDDPGDTVLISTLLGRLVDRGVRVAATSNTLPGRLGEGRFAAQDFLREIQGLADRFAVVRVEGEDYRHRGLPEAPPPLDDAALQSRAAAVPGASLDEFCELCEHLGDLHPVRYGALLDGVRAAFLRRVEPVWNRPPRCDWSCLPTASTTGTYRWRCRASRWTGCSPTSCSLVATARSTGRLQDYLEVDLTGDVATAARYELHEGSLVAVDRASHLALLRSGRPFPYQFAPFDLIRG